MRFVTFVERQVTGRSFDLDGQARGGVLIADGSIVDIAKASALDGGPTLPRRLLDVVAAGPPALERLESLLASEVWRDAGDTGVVRAAASVRLLAPIPAPPSLRDFWTSEAHVRAGQEKRGLPIPEVWYQQPVYWKGNHRSILGPEEELLWPQGCEELDYELEIAMVVSKHGRDVSAGEADDFIFGYMLMNDVSARDLQRRELKDVPTGPAKSKDFGTVFGPYLVTPDEVDLGALKAIARIGGDVVTDSDLTDMHWSFSDMVVYVSRDEDIFPGDIYGSGTVAGGCGLEHGRMLAPGEVIELEAGVLGVLRNTVGPRP